MQNHYENSDIIARGLDVPTFDARKTSTTPLSLQFQAFETGWMCIINPFDKLTNKADWNTFESYRQGGVSHKMIGKWPDKKIYTADEIEVVKVSRAQQVPCFGQNVTLMDEIPCFIYKHNLN